MPIILDQRNNFVKGTIDPITAGDLTIDIATGAAKFPAFTNGYQATIWNMTDYVTAEDDPNVEIVRVTGFATPTLTVLRGQEGTAAVAHNTAGKTYAIAMTLTAKMITDIATQAASSVGAVSSVGNTVTQAGHGLAVDNFIKSNGTNGQYNKAQADIADNSQAIGVVAVVGGVNDFTILNYGYYIATTLPGGAVAGDVLWLSDLVAGAWTLTPPTDAPKVRKPLGTVIDAATKLVFIDIELGQELTGDIVGGGTKLAVVTTPVVITNGAETDLIAVTVPGGMLGTNDGVKAKIYVDFDAGADAAQAVTFRLKYGGTTLATATSAALQKEENGKTFIEALLVGNGSSAAQKGSISMPCNSNVDANSVVIGDAGSSAEDSTTDLVMKVTWQFTTASGGPTCTMDQAVVEKVNGVGISSILGDWSSPITVNVPYQAPTDGFVTVYGGVGVQQQITIKTDASPTPTTIRTANNDSGGGNQGACCPVKAGDYVLVSGTSITIYWIPMG